MNMKDNIPILSDEELDAVIGLYMEGLLSRQEERALAMMLMEREPLTPSMQSALVQMGLESLLGKREARARVCQRKPWYRRAATGWSAAAACVVVMACVGVSLLRQRSEPPVSAGVEIYSDGHKVEAGTRQRAEACREISEARETVRRSLAEARHQEQSATMELQLDRFLESAAIAESRKERSEAVQEVRRFEQYMASSMSEAEAVKQSIEKDITEAERIKEDIARELSESQRMIEESKNLK